MGWEGTWRAREGRVNGVHFEAAQVVEIVSVIGVVDEAGVRRLGGAEVAGPKGERVGGGVVGGGVVGDGVAGFVVGGGGGHEGGADGGLGPCRVDGAEEGSGGGDVGTGHGGAGVEIVLDNTRVQGFWKFSWGIFFGPCC